MFHLGIYTQTENSFGLGRYLAFGIICNKLNPFNIPRLEISNFIVQPMLSDSEKTKIEVTSHVIEFHRLAAQTTNEELWIIMKPMDRVG